MKKATQIKEIAKVTTSDRYIDLTGFEMQENLNPKIWDKNQKLRPEIRKNLLKIADDYIESLEIENLDIDDVTFTGSLANYNWSQYSDVDLHILVDYKDIPVDESLIQDFLKSKVLLGIKIMILKFMVMMLNFMFKTSMKNTFQQVFILF